MVAYLRTTGVAILLAFALAVSVHSQSTPLQGFDARVERAMAEWHVPGLAIAVVKDDTVVMAKGYGAREAGKPARVDGNTLFAIGSCSKAFAAASVAMLVNDGRLGWEDRVQAYLPWFELYDPWVARDIRVRELLAHRVGTSYLIENRLRPVASDAKDLLGRARHIQPVSPFRDRYVYSNNMFIAAGELVSAVSGRKWEDFARERIWGPLGMISTNASTDAVRKSSNQAAPHVMVGDQLDRIASVRWEFPDRVAVPSGGVNSTAVDMAQWLRFQLAGGRLAGGQLIRPEVFAEMHKPQTLALHPTLDLVVARLATKQGLESPFWAYGLGWFVNQYRGHKMVWHAGGITGFLSVAAMLPDEKLGVVVLVNREPSSIMYPLVFRIFDAFLGAPQTDWDSTFLAQMHTQLADQRNAEHRRRQARVKDTRPSLSLERYVGTYADPDFGEAQVGMQAGRLVIRVGALRGELEHWHYDVFRVPFVWGDQPYTQSFVTFTMNESGEAATMAVEEMTTFRRVSDSETRSPIR